MKIAITGDIGAGKTTAANYLASKYELEKASFAEPVKQISQKVIDTVSFAAGNETHRLLEAIKHTDTVRKLMQLIGHDLGRELIGNPCIWMDMFVDNHGRKSNIVVDDLRYENEALMLRSRGYKIIKVSRLVDKPVRIHASEEEHDNIIPDFLLETDSVESLYAALDAVMEALVNE